MTVNKPPIIKETYIVDPHQTAAMAQQALTISQIHYMLEKRSLIPDEEKLKRLEEEINRRREFVKETYELLEDE